MIRFSAFVPAIVVVYIAACGGRVDTSTGQIGGSGNTDSGIGQGGAIGAGGVQSAGGSPSKGGSQATGGRKATGGVFMGTGGDLVGSCEPAFCTNDVNGAKGCCVGPNGPCGLDYGNGCRPRGECSYDYDCPPTPIPCSPCPDGTCASAETHCQGGTCITSINACPEVAAVCTQGFCPSMESGKGCCLSPVGPCGVDFGKGCEPPCNVVDCSNSKFMWIKGCVPPICRDAGPTLPLCNPALGETSFAPCSSPGKLCTETYGCTDVFVCATPYSCPIPL